MLESSNPRRVKFGIGLALLLTPVAVWAGPITFNTALPVAKGQFLFREQLLLRSRDDHTRVPDREVRATTLGNVLAYGVTSKLTLFGVVPYFLDKDLDVTTPMGRIERGTAGFGDTKLFVRYTAYQRNRRGASLRIAPIAGVIAPTGDANDHDRFGRLPRAFQTGTGAWGGLGGVIATYQTLNYEIDGDLTYQATGRDAGYQAGDETHFDASFQYRLLPWTMPKHGLPAFFYGVLESNLIHTGHDRMHGRDVANTGGTQWFISPGLQYVTRDYVLETAVQLPAVQNMHGHALRDDYIVHVGFRLHFQ